ncbi:MAG: HEPN domain-containing protein [Oscillospiraceae bacterium]|nr:HEPN domain-containing protein [Oscillospiraceae bacterium]
MISGHLRFSFLSRCGTFVQRHSKENEIQALSRQSHSLSKILLDDNLYADSANRSYYAVFHSMNALCALRGVGYKKHAGVLSDFNLNYIKEGLIEKEYARIAKSAFSVRTQSDYSDFYVVSKSEVLEQYENAEKFVARIEKYINSRK